MNKSMYSSKYINEKKEQKVNHTNKDLNQITVEEFIILIPNTKLITNMRCNYSV